MAKKQSEEQTDSTQTKESSNPPPKLPPSLSLDDRVHALTAIKAVTGSGDHDAGRLLDTLADSQANAIVAAEKANKRIEIVKIIYGTDTQAEAKA